MAPQQTFQSVADPIVPVEFVHSMIRSASVCGVPVQTALDGLPFDILNQTSLRYSQLNVFGMALLESAPFNTFLPFIEEMSFEPLSEILTVVATGENLLDAMQSLMEVGPYGLLGMHLQYESNEDYDSLVCNVEDMVQANQRFMVESSFGLCHRFLPKQLMKNDLIYEVHFRDTDNEFLSEYEKYFNVPVLFNQADNRMIIKSGTSLIPLPSHSPALHQQSKQALFAKTKLLINLQGLAYEIHNAFKNQTNLSNLNLEDSARLCAMSTRSMQRRLKEESTSFTQVKYQFLVEQACNLLAKTNSSLDDIASQLGFADRASFSKVFKKYNGQWPARYRESH
ncbi:MAG: helix-turn-helix transcriptional regulator [Bermanella sp.]